MSVVSGWEIGAKHATGRLALPYAPDRLLPDVMARMKVRPLPLELGAVLRVGLLCPARAVRCGRAIIGAVQPLGLDVRAGVHTGEVEVINGKVGGLAVNIGARVAGLAESRELLVSSTVKDLTAGSGLVFEDAGVHELKGIPEQWHLYRVLDVAP